MKRARTVLSGSGVFLGGLLLLAGCGPGGSPGGEEVGVLASALTVAVVQGLLTVVGLAVGDVLPAAHLDALTATGGLLLLGVGLRLLRIRQVPVGNLLPALVVAPLLVALVAAFR